MEIIEDREKKVVRLKERVVETEIGNDGEEVRGAMNGRNDWTAERGRTTERKNNSSRDRLQQQADGRGEEREYDGLGGTQQSREQIRMSRMPNYHIISPWPSGEQCEGR